MTGEKKYLDALVLRFKEMNENAYKRLVPEEGGIDASTYVAGVNVVKSYMNQKATERENGYMTTENLSDFFVKRCENPESESDCAESTPMYGYRSLKAQALLIKSFLVYENEMAKTDNEQIVQSTEMTDYELQALYNSSNCPSCGSDDIVIMRNRNTNRYHACCYKCGGKFDTKSDFDSILSAIDVWNLCCRIVKEIVAQG